MSENAGFVSGGCRKDVKHFNQTSITMNPYNGIRRLVVTALLISNLASAQSPPISAVAPVPAFHKGVCILFQGDSITDGNRGRSMDPNHILGHGYAFIIAARYGAAFPERNLTFLNRGVSGNTVLDLSKRWQQDTLDLKPDILSILIGVNDNGRVPLDQYEQTYDKLLADARAVNPKVRFVLCSPFTLPIESKKDSWKEWSADIKARQEIVARLARKYQAALVNFQPVFDAACLKAPAEHWIWDSIHPTYSGHGLMADEWVRTVAKFWPKE